MAVVTGGSGRCLSGVAVQDSLGLGQGHAGRVEIGVLGMDVKTATDVGRGGENNEDAPVGRRRCLVVCDGMGACCWGGGAGLAVEVISSFPFGAGEPEQEILEAIAQAQARSWKSRVGTSISRAWAAPLPWPGFRSPVNRGSGN